MCIQDDEKCKLHGAEIGPNSVDYVSATVVGNTQKTWKGESIQTGSILHIALHQTSRLLQGESKKTLHFSIVCYLEMLQFARNCFIFALSRTLAASFGTSYTLQNFMLECKWSHLANWVKSHLRELFRVRKRERKSNKQIEQFHYWGTCRKDWQQRIDYAIYHAWSAWY